METSLAETDCTVGSAVGVYGDKVGQHRFAVFSLTLEQSNDHQYFTVILDGQNTTLNAVAGCGGDFGKICEKTLPGLQFFQAYLNSSEHLITVTNLAGVNQSFFGTFGIKAWTLAHAVVDLDRFVVYEPSEYLSTADATDASVAGTSAASTITPFLWPLLLLFALFRLSRRSV